MIGTVKNVRFTFGSPFGEQWWTIEVDGVDHSYAMWTDLRSKKWAKTGEKVEFKLLPDISCSYGSGSINLRNCAEIMRVIRE